MASSRKSSKLYIDQEALSALALVKAGLLYPVTSLMNKAQTLEVLQTGTYNNKVFPFPLILAPSGKINQEVLATAAAGDKLILVSDEQEVGHLTIEEIFEINPKERIRQIYGTDNLEHPGVKSTYKRLGKIAVTGEFEIDLDPIMKHKLDIDAAKKRIGAQHVTAMMMGANPLHRAHERLIRQALDKTDLIVIFLLKPFSSTDLQYDIRHETLTYFVQNFLPTNRVIIVPLEHSYVFAGYNEIIIDAIVAKNFGCNRLTIGQNHAGVGMYYDQNTNKSIIDRLTDLEIEVDVTSEYVYCNVCKTLVSTKTCPHGQHHHISYHSDPILELIKLGLLPPAVLMRKEIAAIILSRLFPDRFKNLQKLYYDIMPVTGLLEERSEKDFYVELMKLYQTTSLS
ncbi:MAG: sulfate adenylyltransferase [Helicobacteraceae bacterium]|jgi:sulfate adenylyltransferase|nr:sulfate adenylyltransferase [Helicobacteraceae bacterium]